MFADFTIGLSFSTTKVGRDTWGVTTSSEIFEGSAGSCVTTGRSFLTITGVNAGVGTGNGTSITL